MQESDKENIERNDGNTDKELVVLIDRMGSEVPLKHQHGEQAVNECISEDLIKMSLTDRNRVVEEIHGVSCMASEETPDMLDASLAKLCTELDGIPYKKKVGYLQSQKLTKTCINDRDFRLRFLRAGLFDEREAAVRLVKYCDFVLELFGSFALERHIRLSDFSKKETKWMHLGYIQIMPFRDRSGRRVILQTIDSNVFCDHLTRIKTYLYMTLVASENIETQRKGVTLIVWPGGSGKDWSKRQFPNAQARHLVTMRHEVVPIRYAGYHYCIPDKRVFRIIRSFAVLFGGIGGGTKSRMKLHIGEDIELRYKLESYGIPVDFIPVTGTGNIKTNHHKPWMKNQLMIETEALNYDGTVAARAGWAKSIVECPGSNDVVFKPGKRLMCHPGNILFEKLILSRTEEYNFTSSKRDIYRWLASEITEKRGGRFLKWNDNGYWTKLEADSEISIKISTSCKAVLKKLRRSQMASKNQIVIESTSFPFQPNSSGRKRSIADCGCADPFPSSFND